MPESTLMMLVSAFAGYENIMNAYKIAVEEKYRFFSYGDSMLILWESLNVTFWRHLYAVLRKNLHSYLEVKLKEDQ